jgi:hypothetical protein
LSCALAHFLVFCLISLSDAWFLYSTLSLNVWFYLLFIS